MIPMSRWLAERDAPVKFKQPGKAFEEGGEFPDRQMDGPDLAPEADLAYERGHSDGLIAAGAAHAESRERDEQAMSSRIDALTQEWALRCGDTVVQSVDTAFAMLQSSIEQHLLDVLLPFLEEMVRRQVVEELLRVTRQEIAGLAEPPIEVRAPRAVLDRLQDELGGLGIGTVLSDGSTVEVRARGGVTVFESMTSRWIEILQRRMGDE